MILVAATIDLYDKVTMCPYGSKIIFLNDNPLLSLPAWQCIIGDFYWCVDWDMPRTEILK